jgi:hypothetical protein
MKRISILKDLSLALCLMILQVVSTSTAHAGGVNGGGENVWHGRPLEDYIIKPETLEAYQKIVKPIQPKITAENLALRFIQDWALQKTWYFVPGPLEKLPAGKIGSAVPAEQGALQDFDAIWIDSDLYSQMSPDNQAKLILHEMLMAVKLLRFEGRENQCKATYINAEYATPGVCDSYTNSRAGQPSELTPTDYNEIRKTVLILLNLPSPVPSGVIEDIMAQGHFSFGWYNFKKMSEKSRITKEELISILQISTLSESLPSNLFLAEDVLKKYPNLPNTGITEPITWNANGSCQITWDYSTDYIKGDIVYKPIVGALAKVNFNFPVFVTTPIPGFGGNGMIENGKLIFHVYRGGYDYGAQLSQFRISQILTRATPGKLTLGDKDLAMQISFNGNSIEEVFIHEEVLVKIGQENGPPGSGIMAGGTQWNYLSKNQVVCKKQAQYIVKP